MTPRLHIAVCAALFCFVMNSEPILGNPAPQAPTARIVFMIGEREYETESSLREFAAEQLKSSGMDCTLITAPDAGPDRHNFAGLAEALQHADLLVVSVRRRGPAQKDLEAIRHHLKRGRGLIGLRTASHAFAPRERLPEGHDTWPEFDADVLGGNYHGHHGAGQYRIKAVPDTADHPILRDVKLTSSDKLYRTRPLKPAATVLLVGSIQDRPAQPVAWTHTYGPNDARIFYTSMGITVDFRNENFTRMLLNAMAWASRGRVNPDAADAESASTPVTSGD